MQSAESGSVLLLLCGMVLAQGEVIRKQGDIIKRRGVALQRLGQTVSKRNEELRYMRRRVSAGD